MPLTRIDSAFLDLDNLGGITFDEQQGTPTFKVDATAHRVGIGHNSPQYKLDIVGDINISSGSNFLIDGSQISTANINGLQNTLNLKASLASPALTGTPTAPTATSGTNTTQIATTAFVSTALADLVDSAPATLDTLNELAAALGDDANFSTTITNSIATKLAASAYTAADVLTKIKTVDGTGSGLDADLLDGVHGSSYLRSDIADTATGSLTIGGTTAEKIILSGSSQPYIRFKQGTVNVGWVGWQNAAKLVNQSTNRQLSVGSDLQYYNGSSYVSVWHASNDGSGSGLDADTLDGIQASSFIRSDTNDTFTGQLYGSGTARISFPNANGNYDTAAEVPTSDNHILAGKDNGTNLTTPANINIFSWNGVGFGPSIANQTITKGELSHVFNVRNGNTEFRGTLKVGDALINGNQVWHAGNDGAGSGLDADLLDGFHSYQGSIRDARADGDVTPTNFTDEAFDFRFTDDIAGSTRTWDSVLTMKGWGGSTYRVWQLMGNASTSGDTDTNLYFREGIGSSWGSLQKIWTSGNDGSGSGLDADTLDGIQASSFIRSDANDTVTGKTTWSVHATDAISVNKPATTDYTGITFEEVNDPRYLLYVSNVADGRLSLQSRKSGAGFTQVFDVGITGDWTFRVDPIYNGGTFAKFFDGSTAYTNFSQDAGFTSYYAISTGSPTGGSYFSGIRSLLDGDKKYGWELVGQAQNNITEDLFVRKINNQTYGGWSKVWTAASDGSGSGLDADTLDGIQASSFLRSDANDTLSAIITGHASNTEVLRARSSSYSTKYIYYGGWSSANSNDISRIRTSGNLHIDSPANGHLYFNWYASNRTIHLGNTGQIVRAAGSNTVWHAGNDGSGSGLDADTLDGVQGSSFLRSDVSDTYDNGQLDIRSNSQNGHYWGVGIEWSSGWKHTNTNSWGFAFRNSAGILDIYSSTAAGTAGATATYKAFRIGGSSSLLQYDGNNIWHAGNDGSGSGLDADTLDGIDSGSFLRSDQDDTFNGVLTVQSNGTNTYGLIKGYTNNNHFIGIRVGVANQSALSISAVNKTSFVEYAQANDTTGWYWLSSHINYGEIMRLTRSAGLQVLGNKVWHAGNDGSGSGLDADTLDGVNSGSFLRSDASDTYGSTSASNILTIQCVSGRVGNTSSGSQFPLEIKQNTVNKDAAITFHIGGDYAGYFGLDGTTNDLFWGGWSRGAAKYRIWHAANDGAGTGLDADTVDGQQASSFLRADAADTASGTLTFNGLVNIRGHMNLSDSEELRFGSSNDANIRYLSSNWMYWNFGSNGNGLVFQDNGSDQIIIEDSAIIRPGGNNYGQIGTSSNRWANIHAQNVYATKYNLIAHSSDTANITTTVSGTSTYVDFNLTDDNNQEQWRWRFTPSGGTVYDAMKLYPTTQGESTLIVSGDIGIGATPGGNLAGRAHCLAIGDTDTGIAQNGDGQFEIWANNQEICNFDTGEIEALKPINCNSSIFTTGNLYIRNGAPTIYLRDTNHRSSMIHCNSNLWYILRGSGTDSTTWATTNSNWPLVVNLENNDATFGRNLNAINNITAYSSDRRLKENFKHIQSPLEKIQSLNGYIFDWKSKVKDLGFNPERETNDIGLIAQEVQEVVPQAVAPAPFDQEWNNDIKENISRSGENYLTIQYEKLVPLLVEAIKEQQKQIDDLKAKLENKQ